MFYLSAPNWNLAMSSPYYDGFQAAGVEVSSKGSFFISLSSFTSCNRHPS
jgi:hypothetical protein